MKLLSALLFAACVVFVASESRAASYDAAFDKNRGTVVDKHGNCIRTQWMNKTDPCVATPPEPEPKPVVKAAPEMPKIGLSKEERTVYFDFDKAAVSETEQAKLDALVSLINKSNKIEDVRIVGYTDQFGSDSYNIKLSQKRVDAVIAYMAPKIRMGLTAENKEARGAGKAPAQEACKAIKKREERIECMREERRVEVVLNREYSK